MTISESGLTLLTSMGKLRVLHVLDDSPAARAGLARGDVIARVGDLDGRRDSLYAVRKLLSTPGLLVPIVIERDGSDLLAEMALDEPRPSAPFAATAGTETARRPDDSVRPSIGNPWIKKLF